MTISYQFDIHTATFAGFARLLFRWKGSVYKLVIKETLLFSVLYTIASVVYRCALNEPQRRHFEQIARHIGDNKNLIPVTFILGFYVQRVVQRWWDHYLHYPWPDRLLNLIVMYIPGMDERSRMIRRTLARWTCLSGLLLSRNVSVVAKKRFPTLDHLIDVGLMTKEEKALYENVTIPYAKFWVPMLWFTDLLKNAKREKRFDDPMGVQMKHFHEEIALLRSNQWRIWSFDWVSIPLVYTQVVTLATYTYFLGCVISRQFLDPAQKYEHYYVDLYFPAFAMLQFWFYVGWLKVAESLINPWGEDDDDFEVNWFIDRHVQVAFLVADEKFGVMPTLVKDAYWNKTYVQVPYTSVADLKRRKSVDNIGSATHAKVSPSQKDFLSFPSISPSAVNLPNGLLQSLNIQPDLGLNEENRRSSLPFIHMHASPMIHEQSQRSISTVERKPTHHRFVSVSEPVNPPIEEEDRSLSRSPTPVPDSPLSAQSDSGIKMRYVVGAVSQESVAADPDHRNPHR